MTNLNSSLVDELSHKKLILISGKGGTGKSLVAASFGRFMASRGKRVLVIESCAREQVSALFGLDPTGHSETKVLDNLYCINIQPRYCFEEYVILHLGLAQLYERVFRNKIVKSFLDAMPGLAETMLLGRIFHACQLTEPAYDMVIFDGPALGHFFSLLTTPQAVLSTGIGGPLIREVERVHALFTDSKRTGIVLASLAEKLVMSETLEFIPKILQDTKISILGVVVNRFFSEQDQNALYRLREGNDRLQPVISYLEQKVQTSLSIYTELMDELTQLGFSKKRVHTIPELGTIPQVISLELAHMLWDQ